MCTYDTSVGGKFYVNGNQVLNPTIAQASFTTTTVKPTFFGGTGVLNEYNATQLAIWNRVLTSQEVIDQTERLYQQHLKNKKKLLQKFQSACGRHGGHLYWRPYTTCIFVTCKICEHAYGPVHTWE